MAHEHRSQPGMCISCIRDQARDAERAEVIAYVRHRATIYGDRTKGALERLAEKLVLVEHRR